MKVLIVYAHPEPRSLNGALKDLAVSVLERAGHEVKLSDLYAMNWKAVLDGGDFLAADPASRLRVAPASKHAYETGTQSPDITAEQEKLLWADAVIPMFPLWWFSLPAILKGWVERVYAYGFGYGIGEHSERRWGDRYGEGMLAGKRAMLVVTAGGWAEHYGARGINGPIDDLLFPINHGILFYPGFDVLPPFAVFRADSVDDARYGEIARDLEARLLTLFSAAPIPYRRQNGGDYRIPSMTLKPGLEDENQQGFHLHTQPSRAGCLPVSAEALADSEREIA